MKDDILHEIVAKPDRALEAIGRLYLRWRRSDDPEDLEKLNARADRYMKRLREEEKSSLDALRALINRAERKKNRRSS